MSQIDFFAVGDIVTEPFIKLKEAEIIDPVSENPKLAIRYGDKIPYESATLCRAVGNASNAAVAAARLGLSSALCAYIGDDDIGRGDLEVLTKEGVSTEFVVTERGKSSNYHYVLWFNNDRTILVKHEEYTYAVPEIPEPPKWIYLSSLAANSLPYHQAWVSWLEAHPETKLAFQPGTFQMKLGIDALKGLYQRSELFVVNRQEAERILEKPEGTDIKELMDWIHALGPKLVVITDNTNGAYASDGTHAWHVPMYPDDREAYERTGAGDAFASTLTAALALGKPLEEALLWAPINSMAVVQEIGAQKGLLTREELERHLANAPESYKLDSIS
ncbi:MAG: carbohydrate kinase family protein [Bacillota bacterium]